MIYLLFEIWVWLLLAALCGLSAGWLIFRKSPDTVNESESQSKVSHNNSGVSLDISEFDHEHSVEPLPGESLSPTELQKSDRVDSELVQTEYSELRRDFNLSLSRIEELEVLYGSASQKLEEYEDKIFELESSLDQARHFESRFRSADQELEERKLRVMELESSLNIANRKSDEVSRANSTMAEELEHTKSTVSTLKSKLENVRNQSYRSEFLDDSHGKRPESLSGPQGKMDDLTRIKGVGPVMQTRLNNIGIYHFWQITELSTENIKWLDKYLGFPGRVERGNWLGQAKLLCEDN